VTTRVRLRLFYLQHGETPWSRSAQHTGVTDIPLTVHGETQARTLRPWVGAIAFSNVLTSPRLRTRVTCELAGVGGQAQIESDLAERNYWDHARDTPPSTFARSAWVGTFFETGAGTPNCRSQSANASTA
jgi:broad specificity phosphatase PhoE